MVQVAPRSLSGPTLIRLLARLTDADVSEARQTLSERLSHWLGWTDAIALSTVLEGGPLAITSSAKPFDHSQTQEYDRLRATLNFAIADEKAYTADVFVPTRRGASVPAGLSPADAQTDYAIYRRRYQTLQQAMDNNIAKLRSNLRASLTAQSPACARLAMVDAILERSLSIQERRLFTMVPGLLEKHFLRLRQAAETAQAEADTRSAQAASTPVADTEAAATTPPPTPEAPAAIKRAIPLANTRLHVHPRTQKPVAPVVPRWLATFRSDMRSVLLAELDIRLQPIEGLLAALRNS
jgi:hypothetical protein